jgi:hypothetical protein
MVTLERRALGGEPQAGWIVQLSSSQSDLTATGLRPSTSIQDRRRDVGAP